MKDKHFSTDTVKRPTMDAEPMPFVPGPSTNDGGPADPAASFVIKHAVAVEWATFAEIVQKRMAAEPAGVFERCDRCGFTFRRSYRTGAELTKPGSACIRCNRQQYADGGFMRDMTPAEIKAHLAAKATTETAEVERMKRAAFNARNDERRRSGLPPFRTMAEWWADEQRRHIRPAKRRTK